jgi:hypothetical protein
MLMLTIFILMAVSSLFIIVYAHYLDLQNKQENQRTLNEVKLKALPQHKEVLFIEEPVLAEAV